MMQVIPKSLAERLDVLEKEVAALRLFVGQANPLVGLQGNFGGYANPTQQWQNSADQQCQNSADQTAAPLNSRPNGTIP